MFFFLLKLKLHNVVNEPIKSLIRLLFVFFILANLYAFTMLIHQSGISRTTIELNKYLDIGIIIFVISSDFLFTYKSSLIVLSSVYPVSNFKNSLLSLTNEFSRFLYLIVIFCVIGKILFLSADLLNIASLLLLLLSIAIFKFNIHFLIKRFNLSTFHYFIYSLIIATIQIFLFLSRSNILFQLLLLLMQFLLFPFAFSNFRCKYFSETKKINPINNYFLWIVFYGFNQYKNLFFVYFIVKIVFILIVLFDFFTKNTILIGDEFVFFILLSPVFFYTYIHNNFNVLNIKILKNLYFSYAKRQIILFHILVLFITTSIDFILNIPIFVFYGNSFLLKYLIIFFSFIFSSIFISLNFPKEKITSDLWLKGTTSPVGIILFFIFIELMVISDYSLYILFIPLFISAILFIHSYVNYTIKLVNIFEKYQK